ncbi:MAG TPA: DUF4350 domain-containing protein [Streptosporangiaceae bacterium]|nr:DUF4350 domain-containing protein [Streptosporangiaceae bacterium]
MTAVAPADIGHRRAPAARTSFGALGRWRTPLLIAGFVLLAGIIIALLVPSGAAVRNTYLDPASTGATGARAVADVLAERGTGVAPVSTPAAALAQVRRGAAAIVVTSPGLLTGPQLRSLARATVSLVIIGPDPAVLSALAPAVTAAGQTAIVPTQPRCSLAAAVLAGNADIGGLRLRLAAGARGQACYPAHGTASLVQYVTSGRQITIFGSGAPLQNDYLARLGNAALALNLLGYHGSIAWLVPQPTSPAAAAPTGRTVSSLVPLGFYLVAAELGVAVLLTALWRARRFGPLVAEQLPVAVRASETAEGHARLYQAHRARDRAAAALRDAALSRLIPALGLPAAAPRDAVTAQLALRTTLSQARLSELLFGPPPDTDTALVTLAGELDAMEREVRTQ